MGASPLATVCVVPSLQIMVHGARPVRTLVRMYGPPLLQLVKLPALSRVEVGKGFTVITLVPKIVAAGQTLEIVAMNKTLLLEAFWDVVGITVRTRRAGLPALVLMVCGKPSFQVTCHGPRPVSKLV